MSAVHDLVGKRFGKLLVLNRAPNNKFGRACWVCKCDCGNTTIVVGNNLLQGHSTSCGCTVRKHSLTHKERLYNIWTGMRQRCMNKKSKDYPNYGGRGITVCSDWQDYKTFRNWAMANGYEDSLSIDRIDVNGNYEPSNCRWATSKQQNNNLRSNVVIHYNGEDYSLRELAKAADISYNLLKQRLERGWSVERAVTQSNRRCRKVGYVTSPA